MLIRIQANNDSDSIVFNSNDILRIEPMRRIGDHLPDHIIYLSSTNRRIGIDAIQFIELIQILDITCISLPEG